MQRTAMYCRELAKVYKSEEVNSPKAAAYRKKLFGILRAAETETDGCPQAVELFWRTAYYDPICKLRGMQDTDFLHYMIDIFCGEVICHLMLPSRNVALYYIMLGDLQRYVKSPLSGIHYRKSIEANPELGKPFNQLALNETDLKAVRFFLLAAAAKSPFQRSTDNLKKALEEMESESEVVIYARDIIQLMAVDLNRSELLSEMSQLISALDDLEDPEDPFLPLAIHSVVVAHLYSADHFGDDYFVVPLQMMTDIFLSLLRTFRRNDESDEGVAGGKRRRQLSDSEDSEEEDDDDARTVSSAAEEPKANGPVVWPVSLCCEWLMEVNGRLANINKETTSIPASFHESLRALTDKLIERLNELLKLLPMRNEENSSEETNWLLNGPAGKDRNETALRQLAYWAEAISSSQDSDLEYTTYFRRKRLVAYSLQKKMGMLHVNKEPKHKRGSNSWLPVFVVLDYSALEKHLGILRSLAAADTVISIVPSFVLAELDKMKSTGPNIRDAMRFIEKQQTRVGLRVVESQTYVECCESLLNSSGTASEKSLVALLVADVDKQPGVKMEGVSVYQVSSFWDRWLLTERETALS